jgi:hypothetical protein
MERKKSAPRPALGNDPPKHPPQNSGIDRKELYRMVEAEVENPRYFGPLHWRNQPEKPDRK